MTPTKLEVGSSSSFKKKINTKEKKESKAQGNEQERGQRLGKSKIDSTVTGGDICARGRLDVVNFICTRLSARNLAAFRNTCFGKYLDLQDTKYQGQLMYALLKALDADSLERRTMCFNINSQKMEFGPREFFCMTGLKFGGVKEPLPTSSEIHNKIFNGKPNLVVRDILNAFVDQCIEDGDSELVLKLALLYFVYGLLLNRKQRIDLQYLHLVDDLTRFNNFPWGRVAYDHLLKWTHAASYTIARQRKPDTDVCGFSESIHFWAFEVMPLLADHCANRVDAAAFPRLLRWSISTSTSYRYSVFKRFFESESSNSVCPFVASVEETIEAGILTSESFQPQKRRRLMLYESDNDEEPQNDKMELSELNLENQLACLDKSNENLLRKLDFRREPGSSALPDVSAPLCKLEYRCREDDAWYDVSLSLDAGDKTLTVKYSSFPGSDDVVFSVGDFKTQAKLKNLLCRFRPFSRQLQDNECNLLSVGTSVCSTYTVGDDIRYYDAVVKKVERSAHSSADGEEVCLCKFVLHWKRGCSRGTISPAKLSGICILQPATQIHPTLHAFGEMVNEKVRSSNSSSAVKRPQILEASLQLQSPSCETEGSVMNSRYVEISSDDEDMGHNSCNFDDSTTTDGHFIISLDNLETDLTPSSIQNFVFEKTALQAEACVFPGWPSQPFARGAILVDCQEKARTIHEFLVNPNHMVVSSRGRPWVITEAPARTSGEDDGKLFSARQEEIIPTTRRVLELVLSGTESYNRAERLRSLFGEYLYHESQVHLKLVLEENKILQSSEHAR